MDQDFGETNPVYEDNEPLEEKKDNKIWIIVAVVLVILCCCCLITSWGLYYLWDNGDRIFEITSQISQFVL
jgi:cytochrome c-type biogenesis protein CcmH/NrfG